MLEEDPTLTPRDIIVMVATSTATVRLFRLCLVAHLRIVPALRHFRPSGAAVTSDTGSVISLLSLPDSRFVSEDVLALWMCLCWRRGLTSPKKGCVI